MPDGSNIKKTIVYAISALQEKLMNSAEDDTKSFFSIITVSKHFFFYKINVFLYLTIPILQYTKVIGIWKVIRNV